MIKVRTSLSVINFKDRIKKVWDLDEWEGIYDGDTDHVLFFGLYTMHDYDAWWYLPERFKRSVFWCGSDILNALQNTEFQRRLKLNPEAKHYCETEIEAENLRKMGIEPQIIPSFLGDIKDFSVSYQFSENPHIWMCTHQHREVEYGVDVAYRMAKEFPNYTFHIYGVYEWLEIEQPKNVIFHGQVSDEQLNQEIKQYQCGLRCNVHEGLSEVPVKSLLLGQYPITFMKFPEIWNYQTDKELIHLLNLLDSNECRNPNKKARKYWIDKLNKFPWMSLGYKLKTEYIDRQ